MAVLPDCFGIGSEKIPERDVAAQLFGILRTHIQMMRHEMRLIRIFERFSVFDSQIAFVDVSDRFQLLHDVAKHRIIFDYHVKIDAGRPVILYHSPDRFERGLYFDIEKSPFMIAHSEEELYALFGRLDEGEKNAKEVLDFFRTHENGRSAYDVAERICAWLDE